MRGYRLHRWASRSQRRAVSAVTASNCVAEQPRRFRRPTNSGVGNSAESNERETQERGFDGFCPGPPVSSSLIRPSPTSARVRTSSRRGVPPGPQRRTGSSRESTGLDALPVPGPRPCVHDGDPRKPPVCGRSPLRPARLRSVGPLNSRVANSAGSNECGNGASWVLLKSGRLKLFSSGLPHIRPSPQARNRRAALQVRGDVSVHLPKFDERTARLLGPEPPPRVDHSCPRNPARLRPQSAELIGVGPAVLQGRGSRRAGASAPGAIRRGRCRRSGWAGAPGFDPWVSGTGGFMLCGSPQRCIRTLPVRRKTRGLNLTG